MGVAIVAQRTRCGIEACEQAAKKRLSAIRTPNGVQDKPIEGKDAWMRMSILRRCPGKKHEARL
jgi:hypothetical protein